MKRCNSGLKATSVTAYLLASALFGLVGPLATSAHAQISDVKPGVREFPKAAMRGEMVVQNHPLITINGKAERLTPGARIFDTQNRLVLSGQLLGQNLLVNYLRDGGGQIHQVWVLNGEEAKEKRAGSTATIFNFLTGNAPVAP